jgi:hypothetical protein
MRRLMVVLILAYVCAVGAQVLGFGWVWDDRPLVAEAALAPAGEALARAWTQDFWSLAPLGDRFVSGMYRPVVTTTYIAERALGSGPGAMHLLNLEVHLLVAVLVGLLARRLGGVAWVAGGLMLFHPHAAEHLGNISARTDLLATLGVVASLLLRDHAAVRVRWLGGLCLALAILAKEVALVGLVLWVALDLWQGRRNPRRWLPALVAVLAAVGLRTWAVGLPLHRLDAGGGVIAGLSSTGWALWDLVIPIPAGPWPQPHAPLMGIFLLIAFLILWRWTRLMVIWVAICWAPMAGWISLELRDSRSLLYLPCVGLALALARAPFWKIPWLRWPGLVLAGLLFFLQYGALGHWRSSETLWEWGVSSHASSPLTHVNLGRVYAESERFVLAEREYEYAFALAEQERDATFYVRSAQSLGDLAWMREDLLAARTYFGQAIHVAGPGNAPYAEARLEELRAGLPAEERQ